MMKLCILAILYLAVSIFVMGALSNRGDDCSPIFLGVLWPLTGIAAIMILSIYKLLSVGKRVGKSFEDWLDDREWE